MPHPVIHRPRAKVGDRKPVAQQVIAVQSKQRIEVDQTTRPAHRDDRQRHLIDWSPNNRQSPHKDTKCPQTQIADAPAAVMASRFHFSRSNHASDTLQYKQGVKNINSTPES